MSGSILPVASPKMCPRPPTHDGWGTLPKGDGSGVNATMSPPVPDAANAAS